MRSITGFLMVYLMMAIDKHFGINDTTGSLNCWLSIGLFICFAQDIRQMFRK